MMPYSWRSDGLEVVKRFDATFGGVGKTVFMTGAPIGALFETGGGATYGFSTGFSATIKVALLLTGAGGFVGGVGGGKWGTVLIIYFLMRK
jgi:hypothetical protein